MYIKHSKFKNTGILFELLVRKITADTLAGVESPSVNILKKYFVNTELGKEYKLYETLFKSKNLTESKANTILTTILESSKKLNRKTLKREKYNLVKEIKDCYDLQKFLSSKVKNYAVYASVYKLFEYNNISPVEKTESHFNLVEHVTTNKTIEMGSSIRLPKDEDLRIITYKTLLEKFNQKYTKLSGTQKNLLREYINNISNTNSLKDTLKELVKGLKKDLKTHSKNLKDKVVKIKMNEAIKSIDKMCGVNLKSNLVKDSHVVQTMRYLELLKELKKSANKKQKTL